MYDELVKRLRERCVFLFPHHGESRSYDADLMHQAADAIEEQQAAEKKYLANISALETENQHLKREREWIPVTERLPEKPGIYAVWTARGFGNHLSASNWDGESWSLCVTHWMPLPTPPKEEQT